MIVKLIFTALTRFQFRPRTRLPSLNGKLWRCQQFWKIHFRNVTRRSEWETEKKHLSRFGSCHLSGAKKSSEISFCHKPESLDPITSLVFCRFTVSGNRRKLTSLWIAQLRASSKVWYRAETWGISLVEALWFLNSLRRSEKLVWPGRTHKVEETFDVSRN